jgi:uncharacterized protein YkwD
MGVESRDWYRAEKRGAKSRLLSRRELTAVLLIAGALLLLVSPAVRDRLGFELPFGLEGLVSSSATRGGLRIEVIPGGLVVTVGSTPLYARNDPWQAWLANEATCPRGEDASAPVAVQVQVMLCLANAARQRQGLRPLELSRVLTLSAAAKASDIVRCGRFEHEACGRPVDETARRYGHRGAFGENLYMAEGPLVAPRVALDRWLNSDRHRENLFRPEWKVNGIALHRGADVERVRDGAIWVQQFGD